MDLHRYFQERYANTSQDTVEDVVQLRKVKRIPLVINTHGWLKGAHYSGTHSELLHKHCCLLWGSTKMVKHVIHNENDVVVWFGSSGHSDGVSFCFLNNGLVCRCGL